MRNDDRYLSPHQARPRPPTSFEDLLGDAIERAYAAGIHDLPGLVASLNRTGPSADNGQPWTEASYTELMARLGN
ncbi:MAG: hypothetical protein JWP65_65 [Ramlibacter sp.]|jgi:hypothetical protein|uniref:recombinase-like helix-turn-helix domain-containing protein n=1 Tax=Ramlibacter sp. TaxID=1917967 RepID=UPI002622C5E9|nr:recombinase-like helix-turn-helix domain-containing protein [Ramlibacter sp.]MDB5749644.1 hypothetical protein [Ramlibacter sp.]